VIRAFSLLLISAYLMISGPANADWTLIPSGKPVRVANSTMKVTPSVDWNQWSARPSDKGEIWTLDGTALNELTFFARITNGNPIYWEKDGFNQPLPVFRKDMLPTDLVELFEVSNRTLLQSSLFKIENVEPAKLGGYDAVRFRYSYENQSDGLTRLGEGVASNVDGKFYMINFVAPKLHYFDRDVAKFRQIVDSIVI
jgi:hypothetical protein